MPKRALKQIIIALIFVSIVSGVGLLFYFPNVKEPTCYDGIKNQGEEGLDCGGPCSNECQSVFKDIKVISTDIIYIKDDFYTLGAKIRNLNQNHGSGWVPYTLGFYNNDQLMGERKGNTFILPNQTKHIIETRVQSNSLISSVKIIFGDVVWEKIEAYQLPQLIVQKKEYSLLGDQSGFSRVSGVVANKSNFDFDSVVVNVILYDSSGQVLGLNSTEINSLLAGQDRYFAVVWFDEIKGGVVSVGTEVETNIFDSSNFIKR